MAITLAVGTSVQIASAYAGALAFTGATNATESVLTMASTTGLAAGDYVEITSAWGPMHGRVARLKVVTANTSVVLDSVDTSNTSLYPGAPTGAAGSVRKISTWQGLSQLSADIQIGGGDQQFADITTLDDRVQRQIPTTRSPLTATLGAFFDPAMAWVPTVKSVSDASSTAAVRFVYPNGGRTVGNAYWSMSDVPTINDKTLRTQINLAFASLPISYAT